MTEDNELNDRRRAALEQTQRMFRDRDYGEHTDTDDPPEEIDEEDLEEELGELEAELEDDLSGDMQ